MGRVSAKGGFNLFWGLAISTVISAVGVIIVARILSPSEYGIVTVALAAPNLVQIFREWGMDSAMIRYTARYGSEDRSDNIRGVLIAGLIFEVALGLSLSLLTFLLSGFASDVFQRPSIVSLIQIASFNILAGALMTAAQSIFIGAERMDLNSITMILQSSSTTALTTVLVILGLDTYGAILGITAAALLAGLVSVVILLKFYKDLQKRNGGRLRIFDNMRIMFKYGLPISLSVIIGGFLTQFYNFLIVIYATNLTIGNYSVATYFTVLITFFSAPVSTMLLPAFSKLDFQKETETLRNVFRFSVKFGALLVVPSATAIITLSQPAVSTVFGEEYSYAPTFLALLTVGSLYSAFGSLSVGNLINSQGRTRVNLALTFLTSAIGFPMSLILIPRFGIIGFIATSLSAGLPSLIVGLRWARIHFGTTVDWISSAKILLSSAIAAAVTYLVLFELTGSSWIRLVVGAAVFLFAFIVAAALTGTISRSDSNDLREISKDLGPLHPLIDFLLDIIQELSSAFRR